MAKNTAIPFDWNFELAWLAGILDGEGFIGISSYKTNDGVTRYRLSIQVATRDTVIANEC